MPPEADLIVCDDDVALRRGSLRRFVDVTRSAGFALTQPSHIADSLASHGFTRHVRGSTVRETHFVEIGPIFFLAAAERPSFLQFPEDSPLGWGVEADWDTIRRTRSLTFGIVDAVQMQHLYPHGKYPPEARLLEEQALASKWHAAGIEQLQELMVVGRTQQSALGAVRSLVAPLGRLVGRHR